MAQLMNIAASTYQSESLPFSAQRTINWFPVIAESGALTQTALFGCSGLIEHARVNSFVTRGSADVAGKTYWVIGGRLYSLDGFGVTTNIGGIAGDGRVSMADNGRFLVIVVPSVNAYVFDTQESTLVQITDPDFIVSSCVVFKDGFFVYAAADGSVFFHSDANDPLSYDALNFGTAEINPDKIIALHVNHNELYVLGEKTVEIFQTVGGVGFVFQRINGANIQKGIYAPHSLSEFDNTFVFIGGGENESPSIWRVTSSSSAAKISTRSIDFQIQKFNDEEIKNSFSFVWAERGSFFVAFTFESDRIPSKTFVFDATSTAQSGRAAWHERQSGVKDNRWRVNSATQFNGKTLVGDQLTGVIGELSGATYEEYGEVIYRRRDSQPFSNQLDTSRIGTLELVMDAGNGLENNSDPQVRMSYSDDGGHIFSSEFKRGFGQVGQYRRRPSWRRQGRISRDRVLRFETTANVKANILGLGADLVRGF